MVRSVAIVASTLPVASLRDRSQALGVDRVITTSARLSRSYAYLAQGTGRKIAVDSAPAGFLAQGLYFLILLAKLRIRGQRIVIFHECCMPALDLAILLVRPRGDHFPQVSMLGSIPMDMSAAPRSKLFDLLKVTGLSRLFHLYHSLPVGDNPAEYSISVKSYPRSIASHPAGYSDLGAFDKTERSAKAVSRKILLLVSKSFSSDQEQVELFSDIVEIAGRYGFRCDVKDHPNPLFRLGFDSEAARPIDPEIPSELLDDDYDLVVGTSSTGLLRYGDRALSAVELLPSPSGDDVALSKRHFEETAPGHKIRYMQSLQQLELIIQGIAE